MPSSRESSQPRDQTQVSRIAGGFFIIWATREAQQRKRSAHSEGLRGPTGCYLVSGRKHGASCVQNGLNLMHTIWASFVRLYQANLYHETDSVQNKNIMKQKPKVTFSLENWYPAKGFYNKQCEYLWLKSTGISLIHNSFLAAPRKVSLAADIKVATGISLIHKSSPYCPKSLIALSLFRSSWNFSCRFPNTVPNDTLSFLCCRVRGKLKHVPLPPTLFCSW